jgi:hypothetical protein
MMLDQDYEPGDLAAIDMALCRWFRCPLGTSLYAVAVKPTFSR